MEKSLYKQLEVFNEKELIFLSESFNELKIKIEQTIKEREAMISLSEVMDKFSKTLSNQEEVKDTLIITSNYPEGITASEYTKKIKESTNKLNEEYVMIKSCTEKFNSMVDLFKTS